MIFAPSVIVLGYYFHKYQAIATGIAVCGSGIGMLIITPIQQKVCFIYGWEVALYIQAGASILTVFSALTYLPIVPQDISSSPDSIHEIIRSSVKAMGPTKSVRFV